MGLFDSLFKVNSLRAKELKLSTEEAFLGIALSSVAADDVINQVEINSMIHTLGRMRAFRRFHPNQVVDMLNRFQNIIRREGIGTIVDSAKNSLDHNLKETAFAVAVDIVLADGIVDTKEKEFLERLQESLDISDNLAKKIVEVMIIKNRGAMEEFDPSGSKLLYG
ncbi:MAG: tellurite resistance TerB family protein [Candidatus Thorarchaeota archaeon]